MSNEGLKSLEEIWASMDDGDGLSDEPAEVLDVDDVEGVDETSDSQVDAAGEQSEEDDFVPAKLSDLYAQSDEDGQDDDEVPVDLDQEFVLDGEPVTLRQLVDERLMRKDYTKKTTEVAERQRELEQLKADLDAASQIKDSLLNDPVGTITEMALQLGIIDEDTAAYAARRGFKGNASELLPQGKAEDKGQKPEDIEALIEQKAQAKLEEMMQANPAFKQMEVAQARSQVDGIFSQIEKQYDTELDIDDRKVILQASLDMDQDNLEYVFLKLNSALQKQQAGRSRARNGQATRSVRGAQPNDADVVTEPPSSFEEAWRRTALKLGV